MYVTVSYNFDNDLVYNVEEDDCLEILFDIDELIGDVIYHLPEGVNKRKLYRYLLRVKELFNVDFEVEEVLRRKLWYDIILDPTEFESGAHLLGTFGAIRYLENIYGRRVIKEFMKRVGKMSIHEAWAWAHTYAHFNSDTFSSDLAAQYHSIRRESFRIMEPDYTSNAVNTIFVEYTPWVEVSKEKDRLFFSNIPLKQKRKLYA